MKKLKILILFSSLLIITNCGFDYKQFNDNISKNKFIGLDEAQKIKKLDSDVLEGLCNGLSETQKEFKNHNLILNKNLVCIVDKKNKEKLKNE